MNKGLITRIGEWIDVKWQSKATYRELQEMEERCSSRHIGCLEALVKQSEFEDLKTRIEKIELYSGFARKVDPTKPPVAKSAFSM
jgi:hypothetical protein